MRFGDRRGCGAGAAAQGLRRRDCGVDFGPYARFVCKRLPVRVFFLISEPIPYSFPFVKDRSAICAE